MTTHPSPTDFSAPLHEKATGPGLHPKVKEVFWGYEVSMNQQPLTLTSVVRFVSAGLALAFLLAGIGMPLIAGAGVGVAACVVGSATLLGLALVFGVKSCRGISVRVQVDHSTGELREVIDGGFGKTEVLSRYGLDAVAGVEVVASGSDPAMGQVHVRINGFGTIPVGDGAVSALQPLADRLRNDCGLVSANRVEAVWAGPLTA